MESELKKAVSETVGEASLLPEKRENFVQLVIFDLDREEYAVPITDLQEVIKVAEVTPVPNAPGFILGILNLRGRIVVIIDLEKRFGLVREEKIVSSHIIITSVNGSLFGVSVDKVSEVLRIPTEAIKPPPSLISAKISADYIDGVVVIPEAPAISEAENKNGSRLLILIDLKKMLQEKELLKFGEGVRRASEKAQPY